MASLSGTKRLVVKIGSALLVDAATGLRRDWLAALADDIAALRAAGTEVLLVSSGSIALGRRVLSLGVEALPLEQSQAAAAVGQIRLARAYEEALAPHDLKAAQVLLTLEDSADRRRYLNTRATLETLLHLGVVPIVNENDTVATDEIRFGDNDRLAAQVAVTVGADMLVLLSDVDGLYTANPAVDASAERFDVIEEITPEIEAMAGDAGSGLSRGGMKTKLMAARTATLAGCAMQITHGHRAHPLERLSQGGAATLFTAQTTPKAARKGWIASMKPQGSITVDEGAAKALLAGKSLLPAGILAVSGSFHRGDPIEIMGPEGHLGQGLTRYTAGEARTIQGHQSGDIEALLGYPGRATLIHRDDMAL
ncbi:glutamate 5-kinase [Vannielia sp.]|uniref:glutamate 5-kinase n=1 Tax=Vannielia sp. TaxID=2813045 RepID=UPI00261DB0F3|nr:glutamate 5-kinase [Vannielia sp.]MDF1873450.1 glutamate 5-kinase [Vannielia sp.]